jgi:hypothetical protein
LVDLSSEAVLPTRRCGSAFPIACSKENIMENYKLSNQVFISHARNDYELATLLAKELRKRGFNVWRDIEIKQGEKWTSRIEKALKNSDSMIAILNQHSYSSSYVRNELEFALFNEDYKNRLLPVFIESSKKSNFIRLPWVLTKLEYLRLSETESLESLAHEIIDKFVFLLSKKESDK